MNLTWLKEAESSSVGTETPDWQHNRQGKTQCSLFCAPVPFYHQQKGKRPPRSWCGPIHSLLTALNLPEGEWMYRKVFAPFSATSSARELEWLSCFTNQLSDDSYWYSQELPAAEVTWSLCGLLSYKYNITLFLCDYFVTHQIFTIWKSDREADRVRGIGNCLK